MKNLGLLILTSGLMCGLLANCGGGSGDGGVAVAPLTEDQKQDVLRVSNSMKDMKSVEKQKTGDPKVDIKSSQSSFQGYVSRLSLGDDVKLTPTSPGTDLEPSDDRLDKVQRRLEDSPACAATFEMDDPTTGMPFKMKFSLEMGNEECGLSMSSNFDFIYEVGELAGDVSVALNFDAAFKTYGEVKEDFDVTEFNIKGSMTGAGKIVNTETGGGSYNLTASGTFDGNGVSKDKGAYEFKIVASESESQSASGRDSNGQLVDFKQAKTERTEVKYIFTDFTAVLVEEGTMNEKFVMVYKYYMNGVEVDQEDPKAMREFETMVGSFGVPGTPAAETGDTSSSTSDTGVETNNDDLT